MVMRNDDFEDEDDDYESCTCDVCCNYSDEEDGIEIIVDEMVEIPVPFYFGGATEDTMKQIQQSIEALIERFRKPRIRQLEFNWPNAD